MLTSHADDEYETEDEAKKRVQADVEAKKRRLQANYTPDGTYITTLSGVEVYTEFGAFNDPDAWKPLFESGELPASQRFQLDDPMHTSRSLRSVVRFADLRNQERAVQGKMDKYGRVIVRSRTVTEQPWEDVSFDDIDSVR